MRSSLEHYAQPLNTKQPSMAQLRQLFKRYNDAWEILDFKHKHVNASSDFGTYLSDDRIGEHGFERYSGATCTMTRLDTSGHIRVDRLPKYGPTSGEDKPAEATVWSTSSRVSVSQFCINEERDLLIYAERPPFRYVLIGDIFPPDKG